MITSTDKTKSNSNMTDTNIQISQLTSQLKQRARLAYEQERRDAVIANAVVTGIIIGMITIILLAVWIGTT
jgi:hypothetical protein